MTALLLFLVVFVCWAIHPAFLLLMLCVCWSIPVLYEAFHAPDMVAALLSVPAAIAVLMLVVFVRFLAFLPAAIRKTREPAFSGSDAASRMKPRRKRRSRLNHTDDWPMIPVDDGRWGVDPTNGLEMTGDCHWGGHAFEDH
jgi:hypothetical protein